MDSNQISQHISKQFNAELENLREQVLAMGGIVEHQLGDALHALVEGDTEIADRVIKEDERVNTMEMDIDHQCNYILAKRQPAAGDLRLILTIIKAIADLERIGDEARKVAKMANHLVELQTFSGNKNQFAAILHLGNHVRTMLHGALDAFARMNVEAAITTALEERAIDSEYNALLRQLSTYMMEDPRSISAVLDVIWAARALERIGDHARNVCEYVVYMVQGKDVRHVKLEDIAEHVKSAKP
ncbi:MAG: phosphate signaling complex protein PhoU [Gammaproteobacteria bacterium]|nr:phosphate signaling complex protein PhoU [Gammaproteobacteria bacterium]